MAQHKSAKKPGRSIIEKRRAKHAKRAELQRKAEIRDRMQ